MTSRTWRSRQGRSSPRGQAPTRLRDVLAGQAPEAGEGRVTALTAVAGRADRVLVSVDNRPLGILSDVEVYRRELVVGMLLDVETLAELRALADRQSLLDATLHFLSFRPRSEQEVRRYLRKRGAGDAAAEEVVAGLKRQRLVDDEAFARFWVENRQRFRPRGERLLQSELRAKGVSRETVQAAHEDEAPADEEALAERAAESYVRRLRGQPWLEFRRKLSAFLVRRGFSYGTAATVTKRLWEGADPDDEGTEAP